MRDSPFWAGNLRVIQALYPGLAAELIAAEDGDIGIDPSTAGPPTLLIKGVHVHSKHDPVREGRRLAESLTRGKDPALILGFGLGYAAEALAGLDRERPLIIVEHRTGVLKKALEVRDLRPFLERSRLVFVTGDKSASVMAALQLFGKEGDSSPVLLRNRALVDLDEDWYGEVERLIRARSARDAVNLATLRRFGKRWVRNLGANLGAIRDLPGVSRLEGLLSGTGIPVFLAAAGPSLDSIKPLLGEIHRRCLLVAVDTSLRFLLDAGIDPDFVLSVDPQYWNFRHLDHAPAEQTCLAAESAVYPPVLRHPFRRAFLCGSLFPLGRFIEDRVDPKGLLGAGGSVATTAWDFSRLLGAEEIYIAGLDLAFPGLKTHFRGARFEEKALAEADRLDPAETRSVRALRDGQPFRAKGAGGEPVLTDRRLSLYAAWFENRFRQFPQVRNFRLGSEGLDIKGLNTITPEALLKLPLRREEIHRKLDGVFAGLGGGFFAPEQAAERGERYETARKELIRGLEAIKNAADTAAEMAGQGRRRSLNRAEGEKLLRELDEVTRPVTESPVKDAAGFLFPPAAELEAALRTPPSEHLKRHLEFSEKFYRALAGAAAYPLDLLKSGKKS